jgi:hypothetical protein
MELANLAEYLMENVPDIESDEQTTGVLSMLRKIPYAAMGSTPFKNDTAHGVIILFVDQSEEEK